MTNVALSWLSTYLIHSTLLLGAAWLVTRVLRGREAPTEVIWKCAFVGAVVTPLLVAGGMIEPLSGRMLLEDAFGTRTQPTRAATGTTDFAGDVFSQATSSSQTPLATSSSPTSSLSSSPTPVAAALTARPRVVPTVPGSVLAVWALIAGALLVRHTMRRRNLLLLLSERRVVDREIASALFDQLCRAAGITRPVRLTASMACPVPIALTSSEVCVPERFLLELDSEQQRGALAHEIAHLARRDPDWLTAQALVSSLFFFQPLNFVARRALRESAECLCDDWAARQGSGPGLARCLAEVATWLRPFPEKLLSATIPMAENHSTLLRRVERLLSGRTIDMPRRRAVLVAGAIVIMLGVASTAPAVSSTAIPTRTANITGLAPVEALKSAVASAAQQEVVRAPDPRASLPQRWSWAHGAARTRRGDFWIVYSFARPIRQNEQYISDTGNINFDVDGADWKGTPVGNILGGGPAYGNGTIALMFHFRSNSDGGIDRISHRSMNVGMDFGGAPVYWLGEGSDAESVPWLQGLMARVTVAKMEEEVVDALGLHATSSIVVPALGGILDRHDAALVRAEAAEGLENHSTAASLQRAHRAAVSDVASTVRAEAAEAIGGIHVPGAVDVLVELATTSPDSNVRGEAAEALGEQPANLALRGIERVVSEARHEAVRMEAVEALGELAAADALPVLRRIIWEHPSSAARAEAVETLGDLEGVNIIPLLRDILERHPDEETRNEALDVLRDIDSPASYALIVETATSSRNALSRSEAVQAIAHMDESRHNAEMVALLEKIALTDAALEVQMEALDAIAGMPRRLTNAALRRIADTHTNREIRAEAGELMGRSRRGRE